MYHMFAPSQLLVLSLLLARALLHLSLCFLLQFLRWRFPAPTATPPLTEADPSLSAPLVDSGDDEPNIDDAPPVEAGISYTHEEAKSSTLRLLSSTLRHSWWRAGGRTPLMTAAATASQPWVSLLLHHHADVTATDEDGHTALHFAVCAPSTDDEPASNAVQVVKTLLSRGAAKNAVSAFGLTPLDMAQALNRAEVAHLLRNHKSQPSLLKAFVGAK